MTPEITTNHAVENAAIAWVMELERAAGRPDDHDLVDDDLDSVDGTLQERAPGEDDRRLVTAHACRAPAGEDDRGGSGHRRSSCACRGCGRGLG